MQEEMKNKKTNKINQLLSGKIQLVFEP